MKSWTKIKIEINDLETAKIIKDLVDRKLLIVLEHDKDNGNFEDWIDFIENGKD